MFAFFPALAAGVVVGCAPASVGRPQVSQAVESRFGEPISIEGPRPNRVLVPESLQRGEPMTEEQAVVLALWNNALFHELLVELDLTKADLVQANLLPNPEFVYYWPMFDKQFKYLFDFPIESLYLRPVRLKSAHAENERAAARVTQLALDLIRDTRQAYADLQLAHDRVRVGERAVRLREDILKIAESRLKAGDASELEVSTARIDTLQTRQDLIRLRYEVTVAQERVRNLTGLSASTMDLVPENVPFDPRATASADELVAEAVATRPDAVAADFAARAAEVRVRFARLGWVRLLGIGDATSGLSHFHGSDHDLGPGLRFTVPIFNQGQGAISRAKADLEQLERRKLTVHNQIVMDVRTAYARYEQARAELDALRTKTRPEVEASIKRAEAAFEKGGVTYLIVLELNRQLIDTFVREAQLSADLRRAWAELERGVGRHLK
jgi:cobalt-zinc-cadmium efflux system outer membrane protein